MSKFKEYRSRLKPKFRKIFWTASKISVVFLFAFMLKSPRAAFASVELISTPASGKIGKNTLSAGKNLQATFNLHIIYLWITYILAKTPSLKEAKSPAMLLKWIVESNGITEAAKKASKKVIATALHNQVQN